MYQSMLFTSLAMGNWGSTPSPANDENAPRSVGNEGVLSLSQGKTDREYALDLVSWVVAESDDAVTAYLKILGEPSYGQPELAFFVKLPEGVEKRDLLHIPLELLLTEPGCENQAYALFPDDDHKIEFLEGSFTLIAMTGTGPWQIDAEIELKTDEKSFKGLMKAKLSELT